MSLRHVVETTHRKNHVDSVPLIQMKPKKTSENRTVLAGTQEAWRLLISSRIFEANSYSSFSSASSSIASSSAILIVDMDEPCSLCSSDGFVTVGSEKSSDSSSKIPADDRIDSKV